MLENPRPLFWPSTFADCDKRHRGREKVTCVVDGQSTVVILATAPIESTPFHNYFDSRPFAPAAVILCEDRLFDPLWPVVIKPPECN